MKENHISTVVGHCKSNITSRDWNRCLGKPLGKLSVAWENALIKHTSIIQSCPCIVNAVKVNTNTKKETIIFLLLQVIFNTLAM